MIESYIAHVGKGVFIAANAMAEAIFCTAHVFFVAFCFLLLWPFALLSAMHEDEVIK